MAVTVGSVGYPTASGVSKSQRADNFKATVQ